MKATSAKQLQACPFCRELFLEGEVASCPECGLLLRDFTTLPPSIEAHTLIAEDAVRAKLLPTLPIEYTEPLPLRDMSRGRGVLVGCALIGMALFFFPWAIQTTPENASYSGFELARSRSFFWASFIAWLVLVPAVLSRRTIAQMLGARIACMLLSILPAIQCGFLIHRPTKLTVKWIAFEFHWGMSLYLTFCISVFATVIAFRLGRK